MDTKKNDSPIDYHGKVPVIDLKLKGSILETWSGKREDWMEAVAKKIDEALSKNGILLLVNHGISQQKLDHSYEVMEKFCALPEDVKMQYLADMPHDIQGYVPPGVETLKKESGKKEFKQMFQLQKIDGKMPGEVPEFKNVVSSVVEEFMKLSNLFCHLLALALGVEPSVFLAAHQGMMMMEENLSTCRLAYYPPLDNESLENTVRCNEHTDFGSFTFIAPDSEGGLEALVDNEWCKVDIFPGAILFNVADILEGWTSSKYKSLFHRVVIPENEDLRKKGRHCVVFFTIPANEAEVDSSMLTSPPKWRIPGKMKKFERQPSGEHLLHRLSNSLDSAMMTKLKV